MDGDGGRYRHTNEEEKLDPVRERNTRRPKQHLSIATAKMQHNWGKQEHQEKSQGECKWHRK